jgi:hypothetical protein
LVCHISAGGIALLSGAAALLFRKGQRSHRRAGNVFFVSMLNMSAIGACVAPLLPQRASVVPGIFTFYLVATAWLTVRRQAGRVGRLEIGALIVALGAAAVGVMFGLRAARSPTGLLDAEPPLTYYVWACFAALAAAADLRMIVRGGVFGSQRIVRHLWRMCAAMLIATLSFFLGQQQVFPPSVRASPLLFVPEIAVVGFLLFWLVRVRFTNRFKAVATAR